MPPFRKDFEIVFFCENNANLRYLFNMLDIGGKIHKQALSMPPFRKDFGNFHPSAREREVQQGRIGKRFGVESVEPRLRYDQSPL